MSEDKKNGKQNKTVKPFDPMTLRGVTVRNRIWLPPMDTYSALAQDGKPTPFHYQHYVSRAMGGFGMIIMEATAVAPEGRISPCDLGLWDDGQMDAWRWIVADAKAAGATMAVQLNHAGRKGSTGLPRDRFRWTERAGRARRMADGLPKRQRIRFPGSSARAERR